MDKNYRIGLFAAGLVLAMGPAVRLAAAPGPNHDGDDRDHKSRHVLLISIDGMHAVDYENCMAAKTCPNLAALGRTGVNYTRTTTSRPSDSFPGLMALVTGGSPRTVGAFYDVAYGRHAGSAWLGLLNNTSTLITKQRVLVERPLFFLV